LSSWPPGRHPQSKPTFDKSSMDSSRISRNQTCAATTPPVRKNYELPLMQSVKCVKEKKCSECPSSVNVAVDVHFKDILGDTCCAHFIDERLLSFVCAKATVSSHSCGLFNYINRSCHQTSEQHAYTVSSVKFRRDLEKVYKNIHTYDPQAPLCSGPTTGQQHWQHLTNRDIL
jgi:hypothetical protein